MKNYSSEEIRNICLMGHGSSGKTTLAEAMLFSAKAIDRIGNVNNGTTACDFEPEETKRNISINAAVAPVEWNDFKINIIDTPGYFDFVGEVKSGIKVADSAVICVPAKNGPEVGTEKAWEYVLENNICKMFFISKLDEENASYFKTYDKLVAKFGKKVIAFEIPIIENNEFVGIINVIRQKAKHFEGDKFVNIEIPEAYIAKVAELREPLMEAVAETSEKLMEKYFDGEAFTYEEIKQGILEGVKDSEIVPVFCGSAINNAGIVFLLDAITKYVPSPVAKEEVIAKKVGSEEEIILKATKDEKLSALVFKTIADPFVGKISIFKVYSGEMKNDIHVYNSRTGKNEKITNLFTVRGKKQEATTVVTTGDIGAVAKLADTNTNDTLSDEENPVELAKIVFPEPSISLGIEPVIKGEEEKVSSGLHKLQHEDPTFTLTVNHETHQTLIAGIGEQHIDVLTSKLKSKYGVKVVLSDPIIPYREAIRNKIKVEGKHKKQSGGHGQFGHVWIEFEPGEGEGLTFEEKIFGGSVPKNYIPAVEKGLKDCILKGVLAGYPMVNLKAILVDGSYHAVDSSEMAFKVAAGNAYKKLKDAKPVLLEPIMHYEIVIPNSYMGDIMGDISKRRGRIMGMTPIAGGLQKVEAEVPYAEMFKYTNDLRSMTQGRGKFTMTPVRYDEMPSEYADKIIAESKKEEE